jgi:L-ribulose-5-phosphate 3-epimerase
MQVRGHDVAVCSWSLQPKDSADLVAKVRQLGLEHVQLSLTPLLELEEAARAPEIERLRASGLNFTATMVRFPGEDYSSLPSIRRSGGFVPEELFAERNELALRAGRLSAELGVRDMSLHVGFIPSSSDPSYAVIVDRVRAVASALASDGVGILIETGQETASELLQFLNDLNCRNVGVNFDPANMIIYGAGEPIEAISILGRHIKHVHVKDAVSSSQPRMQWGRETLLGTGEVGVDPLLDALNDVDYDGPLAIERESGSNRLTDIAETIEVLRSTDESGE